MSNAELIRKAESQITKILETLEKEGGLLVESVEVQTIDVSSVDRTQYVKAIKIRTRENRDILWSQT